MKLRRRNKAHRGIIAETVALSNKKCPRYYKGTTGDDWSHSAELGEEPVGLKPPSWPCGCPPGRCWYDEQLRRRAHVLPALTPEEWKRRLGSGTI